MIAWSQIGAVWAIAGLLLGGVALVDAVSPRQATPTAADAARLAEPAARPPAFVGDARLSGVLPPGLGVQRLEGDEFEGHGVPPAPAALSLVLAQAQACPVVTQ